MTQVSNVALLGGNREDLTASLDHDSFPRRRQRDVCHPIRDVFPSRHHPRKVSRRHYVYNVLLARLRVELMDVARLLKDHRTRPGVQCLYVEVGEMSDL